MTALISALLSSGLAVAGAAWLYRRFRHSVSRDLEPFTRYVIQGMKYYVGRFLRRQLAAEFSLRKYAKDRLSTTAVEMHVPATFPKSLKIDDAFVPLLLRGASEGTLEYQDLINRASARTVVIGEPGSGKSSLMKRVFRDACRNASTTPRTSPVPLLYELRGLGSLDKDELQSLTAAQLLDLVTVPLREAAVFRSGEALEDLQHGPGLLILLDGLDEVPTEAAYAVVRAVGELADTMATVSPRSMLIVSTRTQHYLALQDRIFEESFVALQIRPFTTADIYQFLLRWPFDQHQKENVTRLFSRIRQLPSLTEMCTNPLALSMFVARDEQTGGENAPETRTEFYAALVDELLVNRRLRRDEGAAGRQRLRQLREEVLGAVCLAHLLQSDEAPNSIPEGRFLDAIATSGYGGREPHDVLQELAIDTGLFTSERQGETVRFLHLTLCEFLAARELVHRGPDQWREILRFLRGGASLRTPDVRWASRLAEVVTFSAGLAPRALRTQILQSLAAQKERALLLRAAIEAQSYGDPAVAEAIRDEASRVLGIPPPAWDVAWFFELRLLIAVMRDVAVGTRPEFGGASEAGVPTATDYLKRLIDRHGAEEALLTTLARHDPEAAIAVAEGVGRPEALTVVAGGADDFSLLLGIVARYEAGIEAWGQALVHCALRERRIAGVLASMAGPNVTPPTATHASRWTQSFVVGDTVYARLLDHTLQSPERWFPEDLTLFDALARIKPPRFAIVSVLRGIPANGTLLSTVAGAAIGPVVIFAFVESRGAQVGGFVALTAAAVAIAAARLARVLAASRTPIARAVAARIEGLMLGAADMASWVPTRTPGWFDATANALASRGLVLREVLNLTRNSGTLGDRWRPGRVQLMLSGISRADVTALSAVRRTRARDLGGR